MHDDIDAHTRYRISCIQLSALTFRTCGFVRNLVWDFCTDEPHTLFNMALVRISCFYVALRDPVGTMTRWGLRKGKEGRGGDYLYSSADDFTSSISYNLCSGRLKYDILRFVMNIGWIGCWVVILGGWMSWCHLNRTWRPTFISSGE